MQSSNIPFIEGKEEFIFANLIYDNYDTYDTFIVKGNYPNNYKNFQDSNFMSNIINDKPENLVFPFVNTIRTKIILTFITKVWIINYSLTNWTCDIFFYTFKFF